MSRLRGNNPILPSVQSRTCWFGWKEMLMFVAIVITLTLFFALGSISPLLLTDDTQQIVGLEQ